MAVLDCLFATQPCPVQKAVAVNILLLTYFLLPNITSFILITAIAAILLIEDPFKKVITTLEALPCDGACLNAVHTSFVTANFADQLLIVIGLAFMTKITQWVPSCVFIVIAGELFAVWSILKKSGFLEIVQEYVNSGRKGVQKVIAMIPRHRE